MGSVVADMKIWAVEWNKEIMVVLMLVATTMMKVSSKKVTSGKVPGTTSSPTVAKTVEFGALSILNAKNKSCISTSMQSKCSIIVLSSIYKNHLNIHPKM